MIRKWWKRNVSVVSLMQLFLACTAVGIPVIQHSSSTLAPLDEKLQSLIAARLHLVHAVDTVNSHQSVVQALSVSAETTDSITLSLIEAIKRQAQNAQLELTQLTVTQSSDQPSGRLPHESTLFALRVSFSVSVKRAVALLPLFHALQEAAGWRPSEIRGCSIARLVDATLTLHATCSVDVYYFPDLAK